MLARFAATLPAHDVKKKVKVAANNKENIDPKPKAANSSESAGGTSSKHKAKTGNNANRSNTRRDNDLTDLKSVIAAVSSLRRDVKSISRLSSYHHDIRIVNITSY